MATFDDKQPWAVLPGRLPVVALAIHCGHDLRPGVADLNVLDEGDRLREEDPYTQELLPEEATRIVVHRSRFEVDLNRTREKAIYRTPEDAWGLPLWRKPLPQRMVNESLNLYDRFYAELDQLLREHVRRHGRVLLLDMHSYNYRRSGPQAPPQPVAENPEINLGTGPLEDNWTGVVHAFIERLSRVQFLGGHLDVRPDVRFRGGHLCRHVMRQFGRQVCPLAIEVKKFFMDEWSHQVYAERIPALKQAFQCILPELLKALNDEPR